MSFKLFDQGYTAEEISKMHKPTQEEKLQAQMNKWKESEQVLEVLRQIKGCTRDWIEWRRSYGEKLRDAVNAMLHAEHQW